jgi:menaquinone-dependent protoporphyrinogen IX oxidase
MKALVIYKGKYGATRQYAMWLGQELKLPVKKAGSMGKQELESYDCLLVGTSVYVGNLLIKKWLKKNSSYLTSKKIFLFQVAATPPEEKEKRQAYNKTIPGQIVNNCEFYFLPGRMILSKLSWLDRLMLKMGARMAKNPADKKAMLTDFDNVKKDRLSQLIKDAKTYMNVQPESHFQGASACML